VLRGGPRRLLAASSAGSAWRGQSRPRSRAPAGEPAREACQDPVPGSQLELAGLGFQCVLAPNNPTLLAQFNLASRSARTSVIICAISSSRCSSRRISARQPGRQGARRRSADLRTAPYGRPAGGAVADDRDSCHSARARALRCAAMVSSEQRLRGTQSREWARGSSQQKLRIEHMKAKQHPEPR
jgi:hypothetical protein